MRNTAEWLAARMNNGLPAAPPAPQQQVYYQAPPQQGFQQLPQQYMPGVAPTSPALPPGSPVDGRNLIQAVKDGAIRVIDAASYWRGGRGNATETELCPSCGGNQFFKREALRKGGMAPAPLCYTCGYNGMYEQYGNQDVG